MTDNIKNKVIIITGASSGIGEITAKRLAQRGALVALGARRKERLDQLVQDIQRVGGQAVAFQTDVTKRVQVEALVKGTVDAFGRVDVLINNAGVMPLSRIDKF